MVSIWAEGYPWAGLGRDGGRKEEKLRADVVGDDLDIVFRHLHERMSESQDGVFSALFPKEGLCDGRRFHLELVNSYCFPIFQFFEMGRVTPRISDTCGDILYKKHPAGGARMCHGVFGQDGLRDE